MFDEYDSEKKSFLIDKKLNNHINAKNNPHHVSKADLGLEKVENHPFKKEWEFEDGEPDSYISALLVKAKIDELTKNINSTLGSLGTEVTEILTNVTDDVQTALRKLRVVDELLKFINLHNNPLEINFDSESSSIKPCPTDANWNLIKEYLLKDDSNYLTVIVNGKFYHAYCVYDFDDNDGKEFLTLKSNMAGDITININSETNEYSLDLVKWYGLEEERNVTIDNPENDLPTKILDTFIFPSWLGKDFTTRQNRLINIESQIINLIINDKFYKAKIIGSETARNSIKLSLLTCEGKLELKFTPDDIDLDKANWNLISVRKG